MRVAHACIEPLQVQSGWPYAEHHSLSVLLSLTEDEQHTLCYSVK